MKVLAVRRAVRFSPGPHAENDRAILEGTAAVLGRHGCRVAMIGEDDLPERAASIISADTIMSMCQGREANLLLAEWQRQGKLVVNAPEAVQGCYRSALHRRLQGDWGIFAPTALVSTQAGQSVAEDLLGGREHWVKRGDVHATGPGDVVRVRGPQALREVLASFAARGIGEAVVGRHLEGEVVKFYGVLDSPFFRYYAEKDRAVVPLALGAVRGKIERIVRRLGLDIYGGDAVVGPDGDVRVIDINDWPSFASFRGEAEEAIGVHVWRRITAHFDRRREARVGASPLPGPSTS